MAKLFSRKRSPLQILLEEPRIGRMSNEERVAMTTSCSDTDTIPKVKGAGKIETVGDRRVQKLHNGLVVEADGYVGGWMTEIISKLKGCHEPQEEKVFYEVMKRISSGGSIIELGSYWAYYSLWFSKDVRDAKVIAVEPDSNNRKLGERNAALNGIQDIEFLEGAAGSDNGKTVEIQMDSDPTKTVAVPIVSVDHIMKKYKLKRLDILHMDVQGAELDALKGTIDTIRKGKLRFVFVSTHHYLFSNSPMTHFDCLNFIREQGGHVIASHTVPESFSGDGLIVASFDDRDKDFVVETSLNHVDQSLFRPYEEDLQLLIDAYGKKR